MKIIIQCASGKKAHAGTFTCNKQKVKFVADPSLIPQTQYSFFRPDDKKPSTNMTWRDYLTKYNKRSTNPDNLLEAADLYRHPVYAKLAHRFGKENLLILSAGWGLIRSDYLIPHYDITFSQVKKEERWKKRNQNHCYYDFNHLIDTRRSDETLYFFGGRGYLKLYYDLTKDLPGKKVVYYRTPPNGQLSPKTEKKHYSFENYQYIKYKTKRSTNWQYECAENFIKNVKLAFDFNGSYNVNL